MKKKDQTTNWSRSKREDGYRPPFGSQCGGGGKVISKREAGGTGRFSEGHLLFEQRAADRRLEKKRAKKPWRSG